MLQRLAVFAVNTGIWTAVLAVLNVILVCVLHHFYIAYADRITLAACPPVKNVLHHAWFSARLALLQHTSC